MVKLVACRQFPIGQAFREPVRFCMRRNICTIVKRVAYLVAVIAPWQHDSVCSRDNGLKRTVRLGRPAI